MGFLFVDRILSLEPGRKIQGIKHVTANEPYLYETRDGKVALIPSIVGEAVGQLGAWCAMHDNQFTRRSIAGVVAAVQLCGDAFVGDSIVLETFIDNCDEQALQYHGVASVRGTPILIIESALGPMLPVEDFTAQEVVERQFAQIYRPGTLYTHSNWICGEARTKMSSAVYKDIHEQRIECATKPQIQGRRVTNTSNDYPLTHAVNLLQDSFDNILEIVPNQRIVAEKLLSLSAPYLSDHFPRKPVLPLTILLHNQLQLAYYFLHHSLGSESQHYQATQLRKIKMKEFVQPGDVLTVTIELKQHTDNEIILVFHSALADKRVCIAEAVFTKCEV